MTQTAFNFNPKPEHKKRLNSQYERILNHCLGIGWFDPENVAVALKIRAETVRRLLRLSRSQGIILEKRNNGGGFYEYCLIEQVPVMGSFDKNGDSVW